MSSNAYDDVLYEGHPFAQTHPDRLATIGRIFGMSPARAVECRFLELGCGDGGNLLPMAYTLPDSSFVGIDAGARGIEKGALLAREAGLRNVELLRLDILDAGPALGKFDYIVAHGVYSWTPPEVREKILSLCGELLRPQGVAYVSYNAYPGAHVRNMIAEMLQHHARRFDDPRQQIDQSRAMLAFLAGSRTGSDGYSTLLRQEVERLESRRPATVYHDELSPHHEAVYFRDFVARAAGHGLQYLGEADFSEMQGAGQTAETLTLLRQLAPDLIEREQYLDFLKCRRFRQTLLCRAEATLNRAIRSEQMRDFFVRSTRPRDDAAVSPITNHPVAVAAVDALKAAWPGTLRFDQLHTEVRARTEESPADDLLLADVVLAHYACGRFELHIDPPQFARTVSERPRASALARIQAGVGEYVANLCHNPVRLEDEWSRALLRLLDGRRDLAALLSEMRAIAGERAAEVHEADLERSLQRLTEIALLEA